MDDAASASGESAIMKRTAVLILLGALASGAAQGEEGFDAESCSAIRGAVELFLGLADAKFKEAEQLRGRGEAAVADQRFREAASLSGLAANYATVFDTFCED